MSNEIEWDGKGKPPVGCSVFINIGNGCDGYVVGYDKDLIVVKFQFLSCLHAYDGFPIESIKPAKTKRHKWIDAAIYAAKSGISYRAAQEIYDAGLAKGIE